MINLLIGKLTCHVQPSKAVSVVALPINPDHPIAATRIRPYDSVYESMVFRTGWGSPLEPSGLCIIREDLPQPLFGPRTAHLEFMDGFGFVVIGGLHGVSPSGVGEDRQPAQTR